MHNYILVLSKHNKTDTCKTYVFQKTAFHAIKGYLLLYKR